MNNMNQMLQNPKTMILRQYMFKVLEGKIEEYDDLLTRIGFSLLTDNDIKSFALMVNDILGVGYRTAVEDYRKQLSEMGYDVSITNPQN